MPPDATGGDALAERLLAELRGARARAEALELARSEPIAVVGIGCRFPGGVRDPEGYWNFLIGGGDGIRDVPAERWRNEDYYDPDPGAPGKTCARRAGLLERVDAFDAAFFGVAPREARSLDPQQRLLLEVGWEALERAGYAGKAVFGRSVGVFVGIGNGDYSRLVLAPGNLAELDAYSLTGNLFNAAAGRLSYVFGLTGPSMALDTACSASLVAVHLACQSLRAGECEMALAGGVNLILAPEVGIAISKVRGGLSPDDRCKPFDARADGMVRGEGCGLVVLKPYSRALADRDPILALVRGSAVNQDGRSAGLTVPSGTAQEALIARALAQGGIDPLLVSYVEAHGPGTALGDPIEARALHAALCRGRTRAAELLVGSVKGNVGHLETAAGIAGLIKTVLALAHAHLPPTLHFEQPTPSIPWDEFPLRVSAEATPWNPPQGRRIAGVSAFGVSGTNAHVVLEQAPNPAAEPTSIEPDGAAPQLLVLSAKRPEALAELARVLAARLAAPPELALADVAFTLGVGRGHFAQRACLVACSTAQAAERLAARARAPAANGIAHGVAVGPPRLALAFGALDARELTLARELLSRARAFREALEGADQRARRALATPLLPLPPALDACAPRQARALGLALATALAGFLRRLGVEPSWVGARGPIGELAAAELAGVLTGEQAATLVEAEGRVAVEPAPARLGIVSLPDGRDLTRATEQGDYWRRPRASEIGRGAALPEARFVLALGDALDGAAAGAEVLAPGSVAELLAALGTLYVSGLDLRWDELHRDGGARRVSLPTYPFQRETHWVSRVERAAAPAVSAPAGGERDWLYQVAWRERAAPTPPEGATRGTCLLFAEPSRAAELGAALARGGYVPVRVTPGARFERRGAADYAVDPFSREDFARLLDEERAARPGPRTIVQAWAASGAGEPARAEDAPRAAERDCAATLHLLQALARERGAAHVVVLATAGAVALADEAVDPAGAALLGFWSAARREHPEWGLGLVDLDPRAPEGHGPALARELALGSLAAGELVALRGARRSVARLARASLAPGPPPALRADASYLVTGGLGGLGPALARWLVERGARTLVLCGRSAPRAGVRAALTELEARGARIVVATRDVGDPGEVRALLAEIDATLPPLGGVLHCAAVVRDRLLADDDWRSWSEVLAPKARGAWNLHAQLAGRALDFFVLFSSAAAVLGLPGQTSYAAASAFLGGLARLRSARGRAGIAIGWGPWEASGFTERGLEARVRALGVGVLPLAGGLAVLERALVPGAAAEFLALPLDWAALSERASREPFFEELAPPPRAASAAAASLREELRALPPAARRARLAGAVREEVQGVLGFRSTRSIGAKDGFFDLGMDSMMSLELRLRLQKRLQCELPGTVAFDHPSLEALVAHLARTVFAAELAPEAAEAEIVPADPAALAALRARLDQDLARVEGRLGIGAPDA